MLDNLSVTENGVIWECGFDGVSIVADFDPTTDMWTYIVRKNDMAITPRITSQYSPDEESFRGRDAAIKTALNRQKLYTGSPDDVLSSLTEFGVYIENTPSIIKKHVSSKVMKKRDIAASSKNIIEKAMDILINGDPVQFILDTFETIHKGDIETAELLMVSISTQSMENSDGIQPGVNGGSGKGKSHVCETILHLMPEECWISTSLSAKVIFYIDLQPGTIIFSDDVSIGEDLESTIKRSTSNFQNTTIHTTIDSNRNVMELEVPPRICWWLVSVDAEMSAQTINRQFGVTVDESSQMDAVVAKHQLEKAVSGEIKFPVNDDVLVCREIMREIKKNLFIVTIPFANDIIWTQQNNRRNLPIFLDMVKAFALMRFKQREVHSGNMLVATKEDFDSAVELYCYRAETQSTKLNDSELLIARVLAQHGEMDMKTLQKVTKKGATTIRDALNGKKGAGGGMFEKLPGLQKENQMVKVNDSTTVRKHVYSIDGFDRLGSYEGIVYLSNNDNSPPPPSHKKTPVNLDEWNTESVKKRIHKYMNDAAGTNRYMSDSGFFQISTQLKELGAPSGLVESTIEHYRDNPNQ